MVTEWLWIPRPKPGANFKLYCFAHAGAGASAFARWMTAAPDTIEVAAIQLPGRESRLSEEPVRRFAPAAQAIAKAIHFDNRPFMLFGHSAGGRLAIHVASLLDETRYRPLHVFISSSPATSTHRAPIHHLDDTEFIAKLGAHYGPIPEPILRDPDVWPLFARALRADFEALETDVLVPRPLGIPLTIIAVRNDPVVKVTELAGWQNWSALQVHNVIVEGDHFSYRTDPRPYLDVIETRFDRASRTR